MGRLPNSPFTAGKSFFWFLRERKSVTAGAFYFRSATPSSLATPPKRFPLYSVEKLVGGTL